MSKPAYKSQTIVNAIAGYLVLIAPLVVNAYQNDRFLTEIELASVLGGAYTLKQTIQGRTKACESIGPVERFEDTPSPSYYIPTEPSVIPENPDFNYIASLPSAETVEESIPVDDVASIDFEETGELDVDLDLTGSYQLTVTQDTRLKSSLQDSSELSSTEQKFLSNGESFYIEAYRFLGKNNHIEVKIAGQIYYLFVPHIKLSNNSGEEVNLVDNSSPTVVVNPKKTRFNLPGNVSPFYLEDSVIPGGNFTWSEVTHGGTRIPSTQAQVDNAVRLCAHLQALREHLGNQPMRITSFGRPEPHNSRVNGARNSFHLTFAACDFYIPGANMLSIQEKTKSYWLSNKLGGVGEAVRKLGIIHLDLGPVRSFPY